MRTPVLILPAKVQIFERRFLAICLRVYAEFITFESIFNREKASGIYGHYLLLVRGAGHSNSTAILLKQRFSVAPKLSLEVTFQSRV